MTSKYHMTVEQNIFWAKKYIVDSIWKQAHLEGIAVTYPDTQEVYENGYAQGLLEKDIVTINNLKRAWHFVLDNIDFELNYAYFCKINQIIGNNGLIQNAGWIRKGPVTIGGIDPNEWVPEIPNEEDVKQKFDELKHIEDPTERAIKTMLYGMRTQIFWDGNKRTSLLAANQIMIGNGCGIISIPISVQKEFTFKVVDYYKTGNDKELYSFIYDNCISGTTFEHDKVSPENEKEHFQLEPKKKLNEVIKNAEQIKSNKNTERKDNNLIKSKANKQCR